MQQLRGYERLLYGSLAVSIFVYLLLRSIYSGMLNDEAFTILNFVHTGHFIPFVGNMWQPNNHLLNSFLTWVSYHLIGDDAWMLRLPNLLSFVLFAFYLFRLGSFLQSGLLRWGMWLSLLLAHYLIEFFAYTRGYGLSIAFITVAVYHLIRNFKSGFNLRHLWTALLFATLALLANLNLLISFLIFCAFGQLAFLRNFRLVPWLLFTLASALPVVFSVLVGMEYQEHGQLYIGSETLYKSLNFMLYLFSQYFYYPSAYYVLLVILGFSLVMLLREVLLKSAFSQINPTIITGSFLFLNILGSVILFYAMDILYPFQRTLMHWFLFSILALFFSLDQLPRNLKLWISIVLMIPLLTIPLRSFTNLSLQVSSEEAWASEQFPERFYQHIVNDWSESFPPVVVSYSGFHHMVFSYYNLKNNFQLGICQAFEDKSPRQSGDYQITWREQLAGLQENYAVVDSHAASGTYLIKRIQPQQALLVSSSEIHPDQKLGDEFFGLIKLDSLKEINDARLQVDFDLELQLRHAPKELLISSQLKDSSGAFAAYFQQPLDHLMDFRERQYIKFSILIDPVPPAAVNYNSYIWNFKNIPYSIVSAETKVFKLKD